MESLAVLSRTRLLFGCLSLLSGCKSRQREADQITCVRLTPEAVTHRLNIDCESNSGAMRLTPSSFSSLVLVAPTRKLACPTAPTRRTSSRPAKTDSRSLRSRPKGMHFSLARRRLPAPRVGESLLHPSACSGWVGDERVGDEWVGEGMNRTRINEVV